MSDSLLYQSALARLEAGDAVGAEGLIEAARRAEPPTSDAYAQASWDLCRLLAHLGDYGRAGEAAMDAASVPVEGAQAERDRLTWLMNAGELFVAVGRLDDAERALRQGLVGRETFYGKDHPGYAYGLEPLATVLLARGDLEGAFRAADEAAAILWQAGHPRVGAALVARAQALRAVDPARADTLEALDRVGDDVVDVAVEYAVARSHVGDVTVLPVLVDLRDRLVAKGREDVAAKVVVAAAELGRRAKRHDERIDALRWLLAWNDRRGDAAQARAGAAHAFSAPEHAGQGAARSEDACSGAGSAVSKAETSRSAVEVATVLLGLALALDDAGRVDDAEAAYREAADRAAGDARPAALRNYGLFLSQRDQRERAGDVLRAAVAAGGSPVEHARSEVALALFEQHGGDLESARARLERALPVLPVADRDALAGRSHLDAIVRGRSCGCGDMGRAFGGALYELVAPHVAEGLLETIELAEDGNVSVRLTRAPTAEETEALQRAVTQALHKLRTAATK